MTEDQLVSSVIMCSSTKCAVYCEKWENNRHILEPTGFQNRIGECVELSFHFNYRGFSFHHKAVAVLVAGFRFNPLMVAGLARCRSKF